MEEGGLVMDNYAECEICGAVCDEFFCAKHEDLVAVVTGALMGDVSNRPRWAAITTVRWLKKNGLINEDR